MFVNVFYFQGGMEIKLDVEKMCQLVNLDTKLVLKDCAKVRMLPFRTC